MVPHDPDAAPALTGLRILWTRTVEIKRQNAVMGVPVSREQFEQMVADALDSIPSELGNAMDNVVVVVEVWLTPEQLGGRHGMLLGLYEGVPLTSHHRVQRPDLPPRR